MAEPFSIIASAAGTADVLVRLGRYLKDIYDAAATIEQDIGDLLNEVEALRSVVEAVEETFKAGSCQLQSGSDHDSKSLTVLWKCLDDSLKGCQNGVKSLETLVRKICGDTGPTVTHKFDGVLKAHRKRSKQDSLRQCHEQLSTYQTNIQMLLTAINYSNGRQSEEARSKSFETLSNDLRRLDSGMSSRIDALRETALDFSRSESYEAQINSATLSAYKELKRSVDSAAAAISLKCTNEHFDIPAQVSSIFTGREGLLQELKSTFIAPLAVHNAVYQRRFVIHGIGGSGKTQFCCKFAQDNRDSFWGVFWIDASTPERIAQTFATIGKIAGTEPKVDSVLYWLSNSKERWLLIMDNADDRSLELEQYFPKGERGHILITTRNPAHKVYGNVGRGYYDFHELEADDANQLLLKAAGKSPPWDLMAASTVTTALGYLALAIINAGATIRKGLCTLEGYLRWYEKSWTKNRRHAKEHSKLDAHEHVNNTWEANYQYLEDNPSQVTADAIDLLKIFAFFHREDIRYEILKRAIANAVLETKNEAENRGSISDPNAGWGRRWLRTIKAAYNLGLTSGTPPPLPALIREGREKCVLQEDALEDYEIRLRCALIELVQMSLISHNEGRDSFSMHPLQHAHARDRLRVADRGIWAEAAATALASSILLPPLGIGNGETDFNRNILPHLDHVRRCRGQVEKLTADSRKSLWRRWMLPGPTFTRHRALLHAKFSVVYMQCGRFMDAEELQLPVKEYTHTYLGPEDTKSRAISIALSNTLWNLGRCDEAADMQKAVLDVCKQFFGESHLETLKVKDKLGQTLWLQGRYTEAREIQQEAVDGFTKQLGLDHEYTLKALDNLGRTCSKFWQPNDFEYAYILHSKAADGMEKLRGPSHEDTLFAKESLARVSIELGGDRLGSASELMDGVLETRKASLGKQHPYTLLAMLNKAHALSAQGMATEAESLINEGLKIAETTLGRDHIGSLYGRVELGSVLIQQGRYAEAEEKLRDASERQKHMHGSRGNYHPDRLGALIELAKCYRLQGKVDQSIEICDEALDGFEKISVEEHPLARDLKKARELLIEHQEAVQRGEPGFDDIAEQPKGPYRPYHIF